MAAAERLPGRDLPDQPVAIRVDLGELGLAPLRTLCAHMATVRRRAGAYLGLWSVAQLVFRGVAAESPPRAPEIIAVIRHLSQLESAWSAGVRTIYCEFEDPKKYRDAVQLFRAKVVDVAPAAVGDQPGRHPRQDIRGQGGQWDQGVAPRRVAKEGQWRQAPRWAKHWIHEETLGANLHHQRRISE